MAMATEEVVPAEGIVAKVVAMMVVESGAEGSAAVTGEVAVTMVMAADVTAVVGLVGQAAKAARVVGTNSIRRSQRSW